VAEKAVDAYSKVAADATTTLIVPSNMTEVSALIGSAMKMVQAVGISIVFLLRPLSTLVILALGWCALALALGWTTDNAALLATNRMNAASASALALLVSILLWRRYVQAELLQRALEESNQQLERQRAELETLATRDPLTGLFNRREFVRLAEEELARARRNHSALSLLMIDLDHFKTINDRFGHPAGDDVLRNVAELMARSVRQTDRVARFGGEEFMLLLPDTSAADALHLANKLRHKLADTPIASIGAPVTASMGLACMPAGKTLALDTLLRQTDRALYQAKHMGRNRTVVAPLELETLASAHHPSTTHKTNTPAP
jgi:diguanylate cyclase (GGDEF)-like protein